jgi:transposase
LLAWAAGLGRVAAFGVEGTGSYGLGLARFLRRHGVMVLEVARPPRKGQRRLQGKSDPVDAEHAARAVLAGSGPVTPKTGEGSVEAIRLLKVAPDTAVVAHSQAMITLKATLVTASDALRAELEPRTDFAWSPPAPPWRSAGISPTPSGDAPCAPRAGLPVAGAARGDQGPHPPPQDAHHPDRPRAGRHLRDRVRQRRRAAHRRGRQRRSSPFRGRLRQAVRRLPIPASSGKTSRHRLNRGGNRQANAALFRIVVVRMRWHPATIAYVQRRTAEGLSKREIIRCLKRYVAREVYRLLPVPATASAEPLQAA